MCGITGFWDFKRHSSTDEGLAIVQKMADQIQFRGPDASGVWAESDQGLYFGHRRLSILDLSENGHQPMISKSGKSVICYNGEVFNFEDLRSSLKKSGVEFKGHSDTEVILEACEHWGVLKTCQSLIGMFAFAFWDRVEKKCYLVRDRLGIKPLYWGFQKDVLFFGSQPKSFFPHPHWDSKINENALTAYFRFNYVPAPLSLFQGIEKLPPATILCIDSHQKIQSTKFWDFESIVKNQTDRRHSSQQSKTDHELVYELDTLLRDAVKRRMVADVPLGAFLSGGIDSSTVVALMQDQSPTPIKTFSIGFYESGFNEAPYAKAVAKHLKTDHHELYLEPSEARAIIPSIPEWCDEPFADVSQIPTFLVSRLARQTVKVALSGDGGDELFAGYSRYLYGLKLWQKLRLLPFWLRRTAGHQIRSVSPHRWNKLAKMIPTRFRPSHFGDRIYKFADVLATQSPEVFYKRLVSQWENPSQLVSSQQESILYPWTQATQAPESFIEYMQFMDTLTYLPDDILTKVDRASMAISLEARVPLLDHRVVEFAWSLPMAYKIRQGKTKWLLRQVLNRYVPSSLIDRPKMGFGVPIDRWLRGPLKDWADDLLSPERLQAGGLLNAEPIRVAFEEHQSGKRNWQYGLWGVLMFQAWRQHLNI